MRFYKYRELWSSGKSDWEYIDIPNGWEVKEHFDRMAREHDWSEHFRGIEYEKVKRPPDEWLEKEIKHLTSQISHLTSQQVAYQALLKKL